MTRPSFLYGVLSGVEWGLAAALVTLAMTGLLAAVYSPLILLAPVALGMAVGGGRALCVRRAGYEFTPDALRAGSRLIEWRDIRSVDVRTSPLCRRAGLADLRVHVTAVGTCGTCADVSTVEGTEPVDLPGVRDASALRDEILSRARDARRKPVLPPAPIDKLLERVIRLVESCERRLP
jgi:hypothetical protein